MWTPGPGFHYRSGELCCEAVPLGRVAREFATPTYVYSEATVVDNCQQIKTAFQDLNCEFFYAAKANSNLAILQRISDQGFGFDIVSGGELQRLQMLGVPGQKIIFSGVGKSRTELELARSVGIRSINVESLPELELLAHLALSGGPIPIGLRINPEILVETHPYVSTGRQDHKFGIPGGQLAQAFQIIRHSKLELTTLGCHIGSQIMSSQPYLSALRQLLDVREEAKQLGFQVSTLNLGGGFGIAYQGTDPAFDLTGLARQLGEQGVRLRFLFEPGRFIVGNAGILLARVLYEKRTTSKTFLVCDAAMNDLIRPALYGACHRVCPLRQDTPGCRADLVGPICETGDFLARGVIVPRVAAGDYLAILDAGAYGYALSSNYNARPRAAEVLVAGEQFRLIRRRETFQDLVRCETDWTSSGPPGKNEG